MRECSFDYAIIRVVPRVERHEFLNVGVLLSCPEQRFLQSRIELNHGRLKAFAPWLDISIIEEHLDVISIVCEGGAAAGPIGNLPQRARFHWLVAPRSTMIQVSSFHSGLCQNPQLMLDHLFDTLVRLPRP